MVHALNREFVRLLANSGWRQARAARELHTTTATVSRYVNGKICPRPQIIAHFAHLTGQVTNLANEGGPLVSSSGEIQLEPWERNLIQAIRDVDPAKRRRLADSLLFAVRAKDPQESVRQSSLKPIYGEGKPADTALGVFPAAAAPAFEGASSPLPAHILEAADIEMRNAERSIRRRRTKGGKGKSE